MLVYVPHLFLKDVRDSRSLLPEVVFSISGDGPLHVYPSHHPLSRKPDCRRYLVEGIIAEIEMNLENEFSVVEMRILAVLR